MSTLVADSIQATIGASEPWPEDVCVFQQYQVEQITLPDFAQCLGVRTFLLMNGLRFRVEQRVNAEEMSPSGKVPFIQVGLNLVSEFDPIVSFVGSKGFSLSRELSDTERSEMRAYMSMVDSILGNAELYMAWLNHEVANEVTKPRYGSSYRWPLTWMLPWAKQRDIKAKLQATNWADKSVDEVCSEVKVCCQALSERLGKKEFFFGDKPTELDAVVFAHLYTLITTLLPGGHFQTVLQDFQNLNMYVKKIEDTYFSLRGFD